MWVIIFHLYLNNKKCSQSNILSTDAKLECNSQGGDLATHTDLSIFCDLTEDSSIWVQSSSASDEIHGFSFMAVGATEQICPSLQPSMSDSRGMCNYPLTDTFKMSATLILGLNKTTTGVEVSWDEQPGADTYILCVINCISLPGSTTEYFWQTVDSGTRRTFTLTPLINGVSLPRSSVSIYHPCKFDAERCSSIWLEVPNIKPACLFITGFRSVMACSFVERWC